MVSSGDDFNKPRDDIYDIDTFTDTEIAESARYVVENTPYFENMEEHSATATGLVVREN